MGFFVAVDNATKIAALETLVATGARSITVDGVTTQYSSLDDIFKAIAYLKRQDTENSYTTRKRVRTIKLGGF